MYVLNERGLNPGDCNVHVGFDGGQGVLKIGFTVTERETIDNYLGRSKYSQVSNIYDIFRQTHLYLYIHKFVCVYLCIY